MSDEQKVKTKYPRAFAVYTNYGMHNSYWAIKSGGLELTRVYCGALTGSGKVWADAVRKLEQP